jgi:hypothetical protein
VALAINEMIVTERAAGRPAACDRGQWSGVEWLGCHHFHLPPFFSLPSFSPFPEYIVSYVIGREEKKEGVYYIPRASFICAKIFLIKKRHALLDGVN